MAINRPKAISTLLVSSDRAIVTEWRFPPGAETGWHCHEHDYVVIPMTTGTLLLEEKNGERHTDLTVGRPYIREVGVSTT